MYAIVLFALMPLSSPSLQSEMDEVEFLNGMKLKGKVISIRRAEREFDFETKIGQRTETQTLPYDKVHAVYLKGKKHVLTERPAKTKAKPTGTQQQHTPREIEKLISDVGATAPPWWESTPLNYPKTLDLRWPLQPPQKGWNNQRNMGQYLWDIVYPNPDRWRSGLRLVHHIMTTHQQDRRLLERDIRTLGSMYFRLLQDYPRAAFWLRQAGVTKGDSDAVMLAECYWRMGNRPMALEILSSRRLPLAAIKLLGDLGETKRAVRLANAFSQTKRPHEAYLLAGDACRQAGEYQQAIAFYEKVLQSGAARNEDYDKRFRGRAKDSIEAIRLFEQTDPSRVRDGHYAASSFAYNGQLEVSVEVRDGRVQAVEVTRHQEKQFYAAIADTTQQIIQKQSVKGIDATSRATITSQAIVNATAKALAKGAQ